MALSSRFALPSALAVVLLASAPAHAQDTLRVPKDFPTIADALEVAEAGDRILVSKPDAGAYFEPVVIDVSGIQVLGKRAIIDPRGADVGITVNADDVVLNGFEVRNGTKGIVVNGDRVVVSRNEVTACIGSGICVFGDDAVIERNCVAFCGNAGFEYAALTNASQSTIERNTAILNGGPGFVLAGPAMEVTRNRAEHNRTDGMAIDNFPYTSMDVEISSNDLACNGLNGLCIFDTGLSKGSTLLVEGNKIEQNGRNGIEVVVGSDVTFDNNRIEENGGAGIRSTALRNTVLDNRIDCNAGAGIVIDNSFQVGDNDVRENTCRGNGRDGIRVLGEMNAVRGNRCDQNHGDGIDVDSDDGGNELVGNTCRKNVGEGIDNSGVGTVIDNNKCQKNGLKDIGPDIAGTGNDGIGSVSSFDGNKFDTGGEATPQAVDI